MKLIFAECAELMIKLSKDSAMRDEYREMAFEFLETTCRFKDCCTRYS